MKDVRAASIRAQFLALAILLIVLVSLLAALTEPFIRGRHDRGVEIGLMAGRMERIIDNYSSATTPAQEDAVMALAVKLGVSVSAVPAGEVADLHARGMPVAQPASALTTTRSLLQEGFGDAIRHVFEPHSARRALAVPIDDRRALVFDMPVFPSSVWFYPAVISGVLKIVIPLVALAYVSSWLIIRPLARFAVAAERTSADDRLEQPFATEGAAELRSLAASLNVMRNRILEMAEARTRMLSSISHDLRTPLTRLKMRVESGEPSDLQGKMLNDVTALESMINETLAFLTDVQHDSPLRKVDLSSLLQTIATDFSEASADVRFSGPRRLKYVCKPEALTRAVSNLVGNAARFAAHIEIELEDAGEKGIVIRIVDDGPGLSEDLKGKVMEPFFKADEARSSGTGFGLGLSIADELIRKGHGGTLKLLDRTPHGLVAEISLPAVHDMHTHPSVPG
ncbi:sensor histidine kinase [Martelella mangrovi]|uniref:histidine kinase n=1 Tax=Martelella mangrovi TaxID=1397477 RepID=A0ABV2IDI0_9HYPH